MKKLAFFLSFFVFFLLPGAALATIGVGVGTGKIVVDDELKPGTIYNLPPITVLNTGDEPSKYEVSITYHEKQKELAPPEEWFLFSPKTFSLEPGESQIVEVKLNLPVRSEPGTYFAYLEGHPLKKSQSGQASIGIAAAVKLYFTVIPGSIFEGIYYKALSFWHVYAPWPQRISIGIGILVIIILFKKFFNIQINMKKSPKEHDSSEKQEEKKEKQA